MRVIKNFLPERFYAKIKKGHIVKIYLPDEKKVLNDCSEKLTQFDLIIRFDLGKFFFTYCSEYDCWIEGYLSNINEDVICFENEVSAMRILYHYASKSMKIHLANIVEELIPETDMKCSKEEVMAFLMSNLKYFSK